MYNDKARAFLDETGFLASLTGLSMYGVAQDKGLDEKIWTPNLENLADTVGNDLFIATNTPRAYEGDPELGMNLIFALLETVTGVKALLSDYERYGMIEGGLETIFTVTFLGMEIGFSTKGKVVDIYNAPESPCENCRWFNRFKDTIACDIACNRIQEYEDNLWKKQVAEKILEVWG